ncbi:MAG: type II toxin-antitoxin system HicB family antitoxin [Nitrospirae bacterium]|nr:type II toxin-antitoxin system HicB family antitoxin [Nitrospirota bacterium]
MLANFTLQYWLDEGWYVGKLKEVPGVFSQGKTIEELEENIRDAYKCLIDVEQPPKNKNVLVREIMVGV